MQEVEEREGGLWAGKFHLMMFHRLDKYHAEYRIHDMLYGEAARGHLLIRDQLYCTSILCMK
jgi:hypothetical protein